MTKMLKAVAIAALTVFGSANAALINKVDLFSVYQRGSDNTPNGVAVFNQAGTGFADDSIANPLIGTILGGYRELIVNETSNGGVPMPTVSRAITMQVANGQFDYSSGTQSTGSGILRWDGVSTTATGAASDINKTGLGAVNLGNVLTDQFALTTIFSDAGFTFRIEAYTDANNWSVIDIVSLSHPSPTTTYIPLASFLDCGFSGGGATVTCAGGNTLPVDFSNLGAMQVIIDPLGMHVSLDLTLDQVTVVPEPSGIALVGLALLGLGVTARRRKA